MNNYKQNLCEEFKAEVFLFVNDELSKKRKELFEHHLEICDSCTSALEEVRLTTAAYDALPLDDVAESVFINMLNNTLESSPDSVPVRSNFSTKGISLVEMFGFYRLTFGGAAVAAAIILIIISFLRVPDIEKRLPVEMLDWNGDKITSRIERIEDQILSLKSDEWDIYIVRKNKKENWDATLKSIQGQINEMKKSTKNNEL
jgi:hypothetical protein